MTSFSLISSNENDKVYRQAHLAIQKGLQAGHEARLTHFIAEKVIAALAMGEPLPEQNRDHALTGYWVGHRECHIQPDWLLVYRIEDDVLVLTLSRTGSHSDLFGK